MALANDSRTDDALLAAAARDPAAFGAFYARHEVAVLAFFRRRAGSPELAADLTAETFAAALQGARRFRPGGPPAVAWLFGIAHHKLASSRRRGRVEDRARRRLRMEPVVLEDDDLARIEERTEGVDAEALLAGLPAPQRDAIRARVLQERSYDEIARELRCSQQVVRQRVARGLARLRTTMGEDPR
ncbi:MAG: hypothetical protein AVDCRST_MAG13-3895 [uncultured Solirubrobacteraceae bacterium]|uniref:RNA polymerase ECF-type sigma factor n=1 Tax=uncultured Solirubrobacteraceae bacterium TaxID=1162706 RepID=A0A6J4TPJ4_9ACTN|nr:MAG: hypothetical protein AVDCRST_MAG13-3895 [uncultured Solirubrobacteraceae bacterium]